MKQIKIENINLEKLEKVLEQYENRWIAVSDDNKIVVSGNTYKETVEKSSGRKNIVLFKVPPLNVSITP